MFLNQSITDEISSMETIADVIETILPSIEAEEKRLSSQAVENLLKGVYDYSFDTDGSQIDYLKYLVKLIREPRKIISNDGYSESELITSLYQLSNQLHSTVLFRETLENDEYGYSFYKYFYLFVIYEICCGMENLECGLRDHFLCYKRNK